MTIQLPTPLSRADCYLATAAGMTGVTLPEKPLSREEKYLAKIAGDESVVTPAPLPLKEQWLAIIAGDTSVTAPAVEGAFLIGQQMVRAEFLANCAGVDGVVLPTDPNRTEQYFVEIAQHGPSGVLKTARGINIVLTDVVRGIESLGNIYGDTTQQTYSGKNLCALGTETVETYELFPLVKSLPAGTYTFSAQVTSTDTQSSVCFVRFMNGSSGVGAARISRSDERTYITITTTDTADGLYLYAGYDGSGSSGDTATFTDIQIEAGSTATPYEPYVGGIPSPNPDYPQSINVVTGVQNVSMIGKNVAPVWTSSLDVAFSTNGSAGRTIGEGFVTVKSSNSSSASGVYMNRNADANKNNYPDLFEDGNVCSFTIVSDIESSFRYGNVGHLITTTIGTTPQRLSFQTVYDRNVEFYIMDRTGATFTISDFQIERNTSIATAYEPYQGATYTIDLGAIELCKIGNYQDYIYNSGSDWYLHKEVYKITADGTQTMSLHNTRNGIAGLRLGVPFDAKASSIVLSEKFYYVAWSEYQDNTARTMGKTTTAQTDYGSIYVTAPNSSITNADEMKTWFSNNNSLFYYVLATPTDTKITDATLISQLEAVNSAVLPKPNATIEVTPTGTNLAGELEISYYGESA